MKSISPLYFIFDKIFILRFILVLFNALMSKIIVKNQNQRRCLKEWGVMSFICYEFKSHSLIDIVHTIVIFDYVALFMQLCLCLEIKKKHFLLGFSLVFHLYIVVKTSMWRPGATAPRPTTPRECQDLKGDWQFCRIATI